MADDRERRVLLLAPTEKDGAVSRAILADVGIASVLCRSLGEVCEEIPRGAGAVILTEEAILADRTGVLARWLGDQPAWSDLPLIVLRPSGAESPAALKALEAVGNMTLMKRPVQISTLVSAVRSALRDRGRQYKARSDLADRERQARELEDARGRLEATLSAAEIATWTWDIENDRVVADKNLARIFGIAETGGAGRPIERYLRAIREDDRAIVADRIERAMRDGSPFEAEYRVVHPDGTERWVVGRGRVERDESGEASRFPGVMLDITARKLAEQALAAERSRLMAILENVPAGIILAEAPSGRIVLGNRQVEAIFGHPLLESSSIGDYAQWVGEHPDGRIVRAEEWPLARVLRGEPCGPEEFLYHRGDGRKSWVRVVAQAIRDQTGAIVGGVIVVYDIDRERKDADALRESERGLRFALEVGRLGSWELDLASGRLSTSPRFREILGRGGDEPFDYGDFLRSIDRGDRDRVVAEIHSAVATRTDYESEFRALRDDGGLLWLLSRGRSEYDASGSPTRMIGLILDVTERRRAEEGHRFLASASAAFARPLDTESAFRSVARLAVPTLSDFCVFDVVGDDGQVLRVGLEHAESGAVEALRIGLEREAPPSADADHEIARVLRSGESRFLPGPGPVVPGDPGFLAILDVRSAIIVPLRARQSTLGALTFCFTGRSGRRHTEADLQLAQDLAHRAVGAIENARLYRALQEADRRKDEFLAMLAHELRNPLSAISNAAMVARKSDSEEQVAWSKSVIESQVKHLSRMIDDLLDVSRITRGKIQLRSQPMDLAPVIDHAIDAARPLIAERGHALTVSIGAGPLRLDADPTRIEQVVVNLLNNAAKYTESGGRIRLSARREGDEVVISVKDSGIGIPPEQIPRMFELFAQGDRSIARSEGGLGIGLTLVRTLCEMHGGRVGASSEGRGKGSEFVVRLPALDGSEVGPAIEPPSAPRARSAGSRVLVVDDNVDNASGLSRLLKILGHDVRTVHDGPAAIQAARDYRPGIVLLDIGLPGMDGFQVAARLRADSGCENALIIAVSGYAQEDDRRKSREAGIDHHLVKPVDQEVLFSLLSAAPAST